MLSEGGKAFDCLLRLQFCNAKSLLGYFFLMSFIGNTETFMWALCENIVGFRHRRVRKSHHIRFGILETDPATTMYLHGLFSWYLMLSTTISRTLVNIPTVPLFTIEMNSPGTTSNRVWGSAARCIPSTRRSRMILLYPGGVSTNQILVNHFKVLVFWSLSFAMYSPPDLCSIR